MSGRKRWTHLDQMVGEGYETDVNIGVKDRIERAEELAHRARVHLDLWVALTLKSAVDPFIDELDEYDDFFRFTQAAHESVFINRITSLLQPDKEAENIPGLINDASRQKIITPGVTHECRSAVAAANPMFRKVKLIRDNAMAYQHRYRKQPDVYIEAQVSLDGMIDLSDRVLSITGSLMRTIGRDPRVVYTNPVGSLERMLTALRQA